MSVAARALVALLLARAVGLGSSSDWTDSRADYVTLYNHYYNGGVSLTDIIPVNNQSAGIKVRLAMSLDSLNGFDAVKGEIDISGSISLEWTDESKTYGPLTFLGTDTLLIDYDKAWAPSLVLLNAVDTVKDIGDTTYKLEYNLNTFLVKWQPRVLLRASCSPDVTYYPFDRQECSFTYTPWGFMSEEIQLEVMTSEWDLTRYSGNGIWSIYSTKSTTYEDAGSYFVDFVIVIEREPLYFTFNVALPILLLGLLNGFVFLLPFESGERVGFCVTCFLSFVVLLQTTMTFMPQLASPMSLLCYYVFTMMCFSAFINIATILMLRIYHKDERDTMPKWLRVFVRVVGCRICTKKPEDDTVTWPDVGRTLDFFFFIAFIAAQATFTMIFILPIGTNKG